VIFLTPLLETVLVLLRCVCAFAMRSAKAAHGARSKGGKLPMTELQVNWTGSKGLNAKESDLQVRQWLLPAYNAYCIAY
jgi:hypothetical protein